MMGMMIIPAITTLMMLIAMMTMRPVIMLLLLLTIIIVVFTTTHPLFVMLDSLINLSLQVYLVLPPHRRCSGSVFSSGKEKCGRRGVGIFN